MRRVLVVFVAALLLASCTQLVYPPGANLHVYNSAWVKVAEATVRAAVASRGVDQALTLEEFVAEYNAAHTDDQLFLVEGEEVPVQEAPDAPAWIVNASTLAVYWSDTVERADLASRRDAWRMSVECMADPDTGQVVPCTLYVDRLPPEPPVIVPPVPKLWTGLLDMVGRITWYESKSATEDDAIARYRSLSLQAELNTREYGGTWQAYIAENQYIW